MTINDGTPFVGSECAAVGLNDRDFRCALSENTLRRLFYGVYVDADVPDSRELRIAAIKLVTPSYAVVSDSSAAWLFGVDTFRPSDRFLMTPSLVIPHGVTRVTYSNVSCREAHIDPSDIIEIDSLLVTNPLRTTVDLMRSLWRPYALAAADGMARAELVSVDEVRDYVARLRGYPRIVQARQLMKLIDPKAESPGESWTRLRLIDAGFPRPKTQIVVTDNNGDEIGRLDIGYEDQLAAIEYDGKQFHTSTGDRAHDERRREYIADLLGWRFTTVDAASALGPDPTLELKVGAWLNMEPRLPRTW